MAVGKKISLFTFASVEMTSLKQQKKTQSSAQKQKPVPFKIFKYYYYIFSKGGFTEGLKEAAVKENVCLLTLEDMYK